VKPNHLGEFKTPTLRNVAQTAPYMHHGHFATLREVLDFYSELPGDTIFGHREETLKPGHFTEEEKADLEAFLHTLTGAPLDESVTRPPQP
jgi:cytochrome c peroxidase